MDGKNSKQILNNENLLSDFESVSLSSQYTASYDGFLIITPPTNTSGSIPIIINNKTVTYVSRNGSDNYNGQIAWIPIVKGDVINAISWSITCMARWYKNRNYTLR